MDGIDDTISTPDGRTVGVLARGPVNGVPVMYLHGTPGSRLEQGLTFPGEVLDRFGIRVVSIDRPGHGKTDPLAGTRVQRAQDVVSVADALEIDQFAVVGISCGGSNALAIAAHAPERVRRVVLCGGQMPYDDDMFLTGLQPSQAAGLRFLRAGRSSAIEDYYNQARQDMLDDPVAAFSVFTATLSAWEQAWFAKPWVRDAFAADMREGFRTSAEGYIQDALSMVTPLGFDPSTIACPIRAIHGTDDDFEPIANLRRILHAVPDAQVFTLEGLNHFGSLMFPDLTASLCLNDSWS